jgi:hypothetical protein
MTEQLELGVTIQPETLVTARYAGSGPDRLTKSARLYVSPRTRPLNAYEMETRRMAYQLKERDCPEGVLLQAASAMGTLVSGPCNLIPVPGHTGSTAANARLSRAIAGYVTGGAFIYDILGRRAPVASACVRHRTGQPPLSVADHGIIRTSSHLIPCRPTYLVDNVVTSGRTLAACRLALGFGTGLVFADASFHRHT